MHGPQPIADSLRREFGAFVLERYPFAATSAREALAAATGVNPVLDSGIDRLREPFAREFRARLQRLAPIDLSDPTPGVSATQRFEQAVEDIVEACDGFLKRAAIRASLTSEERLEILRGMLLTRATDNRLKAFFTNGEVRYGDSVFQGKGFRSLGQEAIYGAAIRLRRGNQYRDGDEWRMDFSRFNQYKEAAPAKDSGGWAWSPHGVWDSHIPELFTRVRFSTQVVASINGTSPGRPGARYPHRLPQPRQR